MWPTARRPCVTVPENNPEPIDELEKETPTRGPERSNVAPLVLLRPSGQPQRRRLGPHRHPKPHGLHEQSTSDEVEESDDLTVDENEKVDGFRKAPAKVAPAAAASVETHGGRRPSGSNERVMFGTGFISISLGTRTLDAHCEQCGLAANRSWLRFPRAKAPHMRAQGRPLGLLPQEGCGVSAPVDPPPEGRVQGCQWILRFLMVRQLHFAQFSYTKIPQVSTPFR